MMRNILDLLGNGFTWMLILLAAALILIPFGAVHIADCLDAFGELVR